MYLCGDEKWKEYLGGNEPKSTERYRFEMHSGKEKDEDIRALIKSTDAKPLNLGFRTDFTWTPSGANRIGFWIDVRYIGYNDDAMTTNAALRSQDWERSGRRPTTGACSWLGSTGTSGYRQLRRYGHNSKI